MWSVTSFSELRKMVWKLKDIIYFIQKRRKKSYIEECLGSSEGPILAASDYMRLNSDQIRSYINKSFYSLGTDGYGRSDTRKNLKNSLR